MSSFHHYHGQRIFLYDEYGEEHVENRISSLRHRFGENEARRLSKRICDQEVFLESGDIIIVAGKGMKSIESSNIQHIATVN
ncbi:hypothetical protein [Jeotgalibacillus marinus]|uniref:Uncharacterized protein n=1 Tax=Jeotgalibacillus marinus TaxID=86667 RepID=A0ABV3Q7P7_9BACL